MNFKHALTCSIAFFNGSYIEMPTIHHLGQGWSESVIRTKLSLKNKIHWVSAKKTTYACQNCQWQDTRVGGQIIRDTCKFSHVLGENLFSVKLLQLVYTCLLTAINESFVSFPMRYSLLLLSSVRIAVVVQACFRPLSLLWLEKNNWTNEDFGKTVTSHHWFEDVKKSVS